MEWAQICYLLMISNHILEDQNAWLQGIANPKAGNMPAGNAACMFLQLGVVPDDLSSLKLSLEKTAYRVFGIDWYPE